MHPQSTPTTPPAEPAQDLTAATALIRRLYSAGWEGDHVTPVWRGPEHAVHHGTGRQVAATVDADGQVAELRITGGLTLVQAVAAVDAAGLAPTPAPTDGTLLTAQQLQHAIALMAIRYGDARQDYAHALHARASVRMRHLDRAQRRFVALQRLTAALGRLTANGGDR